MGGSILPATVHNGKIYFLFGKERDIDENPGWSDFGGGTDKGETFMTTAIREGGEELTGFLGNDAYIRKLLRKYGTFNVDYKSHGYSTYRCHIFPMVYDEYLPHYYNNNQAFLQKRLDPKIIRDTKIFEKTQIRWFSFDELKSRQKEFRSFYQNVVHLILGYRSAIEGFVFGALGKNSLKTAKRRAHTNKRHTRSKRSKRSKRTRRH
jgi:8-oxo-dGTP pyrophosphatase MutT (NUDIX family)